MFAAEWEYSGSVLIKCVALFEVKEMDVVIAWNINHKILVRVARL